jgi:hypothetical protein
MGKASVRNKKITFLYSIEKIPIIGKKDYERERITAFIF